MHFSNGFSEEINCRWLEINCRGYLTRDFDMSEVGATPPFPQLGILYTNILVFLGWGGERPF